MRKLLILLLCSDVAWGAPSFVAGHSCKASTSASVSTLACSAAISATAGNVIVCVGALGANLAPTSITNTGTGTATPWTIITAMRSFDSTTTEEIIGGWAPVTVTGTILPSWNFTATAFDEILCAEYTGVQGASDTGNSIGNAAAGTGTNATKSGQITTTTDGDLLVGAVQNGSDNTTAFTAGTLSAANTKVDCETATSGLEMCMEWSVQTTHAAATESDWTGNSTTARTTGNILAIKASAGAAAATVCPSEEMLGVGCSL